MKGSDCVWGLEAGDYRANRVASSVEGKATRGGVTHSTLLRS